MELTRSKAKNVISHAEIYAGKKAIVRFSKLTVKRMKSNMVRSFPKMVVRKAMTDYQIAVLCKIDTSDRIPRSTHRITSAC